MFLSLIMPLIACKADIVEVQEEHAPIGRISGVVINEDGAALPDVLVRSHYFHASHGTQKEEANENQFNSTKTNQSETSRRKIG